jgi:hypothetical protein
VLDGFERVDRSRSLVTSRAECIGELLWGREPAERTGFAFGPRANETGTTLALPAVEPADEPINGIANHEEELVPPREVCHPHAMRVQLQPIVPGLTCILEGLLHGGARGLPGMEEVRNRLPMGASAKALDL